MPSSSCGIFKSAFERHEPDKARHVRAAGSYIGQVCNTQQYPVTQSAWQNKAAQLPPLVFLPRYEPLPSINTDLRQHMCKHNTALLLQRARHRGGLPNEVLCTAPAPALCRSHKQGAPAAPKRPRAHPDHVHRPRLSETSPNELVDRNGCTTHPPVAALTSTSPLLASD